MALFDADEIAPASSLEPVMIEQVRLCHFKAKPDEDGHKRLGCARCGKAKHDPFHYGTPKSINVFGSGNPRLYWEMKRKWSAILLPLLRDSGLPLGLAKVMVDGELTFDSRRARDQGNYRVLIEKALGDVLVAGGWLEDDTWDRYEFGNLTARVVPGQSATRLMLFPVLDVVR